MKFKEYVVEVLKTESNNFEKISERMTKERNIRLLHASMGVCTEVGELFEMLAKPKLDLTNLQEEVGDSYWYLGVAVNELQIDPDQFMEKVMARTQKFSFFQRIFIAKSMRVLISRSTMSACQMLDLMKKGVFYGPKEGKPEIDTARMEDLMVETMAYLVDLLNLTYFNHEKAMDVNIAKLQKKRFKTGKFTEGEAHNRNLAEEHKVLSGEEK